MKKYFLKFEKMKTKITFVIVIVLLVLLSSCRKHETDGEEMTPKSEKGGTTTVLMTESVTETMQTEPKDTFVQESIVDQVLTDATYITEDNNEDDMLIDDYDYQYRENELPLG